MSQSNLTGAELAAELAARDIDGMDSPAVEAAVRSLAKVRSWVDAYEARLAARAKKLAVGGSGGGARETLAHSGGRSGREAQKAADRSETLQSSPALEDALASGDVNADHVDAVARAAAAVPEDKRDELLADPDIADAARRMPPDPFNTYMKRKARALSEDEGRSRAEEQKRATRLKTWIRKDGMVVVNGELDPELGNRLLTGLDAEMETMAQRDRAPKNDRTRALALVALVDRGVGAGPNGNATEVLVIDAATLTGGLHGQSVAETSLGMDLAPDAIRRRMCDSVICPTVLDRATGLPLFSGREVRTATRAQRRALRAMYPTCGFDACGASFDHCEIHHVVPWHRGGLTDLDNLIPLCHRHHHLVHEGRWKIRLLADRSLEIRQPDGRHHKTVPAPTAPPRPKPPGPSRPAHNRAA